MRFAGLLAALATIDMSAIQRRYQTRQSTAIRFFCNAKYVAWVSMTQVSFGLQARPLFIHQCHVLGTETPGLPRAAARVVFSVTTMSLSAEPGSSCTRVPQVAALWDVLSGWGRLESLVLGGVYVLLADILGAGYGGGRHLTELHLLFRVGHEYRCRPQLKGSGRGTPPSCARNRSNPPGNVGSHLWPLPVAANAVESGFSFEKMSSVFS